MPPQTIAQKWDELQSGASPDLNLLAPGEIGRLTFPDFQERHPARVRVFEVLTSDSATPTAKMEAFRMLKALNGLDGLVRRLRSGEDATLYEGQIPVVESLQRHLESGETTGYLSLPTRSGKTVIFAKIAEAMGIPTIVLEPTKDLVIQTQGKFVDFTPEFKTRLEFGDKKDKHHAPVTISTNAYFLSASRRGRIEQGQYPLIIIDEAHEVLSKELSKLIRLHLGHSIVVGVTATPEYSEKKTLAKLLGKEIHSMSIQEAAEWGMIAPFTVMTAETEVDLSDVATNYAGEYSDADLERALNTQAMNRSAVDLYCSRFKGQAAFAYVSTKAHAADLAAEFRRRHVRAESMLGDRSTEERQDLLRRLQSGDLDVLTNVKLATRGTDVKRVSVVLNVAPTTSIVAAAQRGGRVVTPDPDNPDKIGTIVEFLHRDRAQRRTQMTYSDVANCACILPPKKGEKVGPRDRTIPPQLKVDGLVVTVNPEEVMKVISVRRPRYLNETFEAAAACDEAGRRYRESIVTANDQVLKFPFALQALRRNKWLAHDKKDTLLRAALKKAMTQVEAGFEKSIQGDTPAPVVRALTSRNAEMVQHFMRKFENAHFTDAELTQVQERVEKAHRKLKKALAPLKEIADSKGVGVVSILVKADERLARGCVIVPKETEFSLDDKEVAQVREVIQERIAPLEKKVLMRWDAFLKAYRTLHADDQLQDQLIESLKTSGLALADEYFGKRAVEGENDDLRQELALSVLTGINDFAKNSNYRYSSLLLQKFGSVWRQHEEAEDQALGTSNSAMMSNIYAADQQFRAENRGSPTLEEFGELTGMKKRLGFERFAQVQQFQQPLTFFSELDQAKHSAPEGEWSDFDRTVDRGYSDPNFADTLEAEVPGMTPEVKAETNELLERAMKALPPHYLQAINMCFGFGEEATGVAGVAAWRGTSEVSARALINKAVTRIGEEVKALLRNAEFARIPKADPWQ